MKHMQSIHINELPPLTNESSMPNQNGSAVGTKVIPKRVSTCTIFKRVYKRTSQATQ